MKKQKRSAGRKPGRAANARTPAKKIIKKTKALKAVSRRKATPKKPSRFTPINANLLQQEISHSKFALAEIGREYVAASQSTELPGSYNEDKIIAQVRDPWWIHTYWEVRYDTVEGIKNRLGGRFNGAKAILRVYDVSFINFDGTNAHHYFDIEISFDAQSWYIDIGAAGRSWCIDIGFRLPDGSFILIARSNCVTTPLDGPSWLTDEEWMIPDDKFARLYGMGFGFGPSSPRKAMRFKEWITSHGLFSISSPVKRVPSQKKRGFWFKVDTELIVHGATEPDAKVTVCGRPVKLNSDGTFSLKFSLPDGRQTIPVEARSFDGQEHRALTPIVSRETRDGKL